MWKRGWTSFGKPLSGVIPEGNELASPRGCLVSNTATEFAQSDRQIATMVSGGQEGYREMFRKAVARGQHDGSIRSNSKAEELADFLFTNKYGLRTMVKAGTAETTLQKTVEMIVATIR